MLRILAIVSAFLVSATSFADGNAVGGILGFDSVAKITIGADYEREIEKNFGFGGGFRYWAKDDDGPTFQNGMFILNGFMRIHLPQKRWDFSVAPGFAIINISPVSAALDDTTTLGPSFNFAAMYQFTSLFSLGMEHSSYWVWLDEDYAGQVVSDATIKGVFSF